MWRATALLTEEDGSEWLAFAEASTLELSSAWLANNIHDGELRKKRKPT